MTEPKPVLTARMQVDTANRCARMTSFGPYQEHPEDVTIDQGFDGNGPLGRTWWRIVERNGKKLYLSTVSNSKDNAITTEDGHVCRPGQFLRIETELP